MSKPTMAQEALQTKQQWISVDERLPGGNEIVIIFLNDIRYDKSWVSIGIIINCEWFLLDLREKFYTYETKLTNLVTHWMPLPEPPNMEEADG